MGAALAAVSVASGKAPPDIPAKLSELRNKAIHAGEYPSAKDAEWACLEVERIVREFEALLEASAPPLGDRLPYAAAVAAAAFAQWHKDHPGEAPRAHLSAQLACVLAPGIKVPAVGRLRDYREGNREHNRL
jgi:hypothetical protein